MISPHLQQLSDHFDGNDWIFHLFTPPGQPCCGLSQKIAPTYISYEGEA
jgi:hypothetical protein